MPNRLKISEAIRGYNSRKQTDQPKMTLARLVPLVFMPEEGVDEDQGVKLLSAWNTDMEPTNGRIVRPHAKHIARIVKALKIVMAEHVAEG